MSKYKVSEPSALKFLKANGAVVDENGNVVSDASDYTKVSDTEFDAILQSGASLKYTRDSTKDFTLW